MADEQHYFTIQARATYAVWPGGAFVCAKVSAPKYMPDQWYLGNVETGTVSILAPYVYRRPR